MITLLTDFGVQDYFVAAMKGVILSINPAAQIVDLTHDIPPQDIEAAAFNLLACYRDFPRDSVHVAVVDPGVGSDRRAIMLACAGQFFIGPDNGLFSWICEREQQWQGVTLTSDTFFRHPVSNTFHGRDIFAPAAAALSTGRQIKEFGEPLSDIVRLPPLAAEAADGTIAGRIIHIDRFGNCITNLRACDVDDRLGTGVSVTINGHTVTAVRQFFSQAQLSEKPELFLIVGSSGFVEVAARNASAAAILGAERRDLVTVRRPKSSS